MEPALTTLLALEIAAARRGLTLEMKRTEHRGTTHDWYTLGTRDRCFVVDRKPTCQEALASLRWVLEQAVAAARGLPGDLAAADIPRILAAAATHPPGTKLYLSEVLREPLAPPIPG